MPEQQKKQTTTEETKWTPQRWAIALIMSVVIVGLNIAMLLIFREALPIAIASVGIITFVGILMLTNFLSRDSELSKAEVRRAIAGSCVVVYFGLLALVLSGNGSDNDLAETVVGHFTYIIGIIIVFYFGSRGAEVYLKLKQEMREEGGAGEGKDS